MPSGSRQLAVCVVLGLLSGCASEQQRTQQAAARLQSAAGEFYLSHRRYPRSLAELQASASAGSLDLHRFAEVDLKPGKDGGLSIWVVPKKKRDPNELGIIMSISSSVVSGCGSLGQAGRPADK